MEKSIKGKNRIDFVITTKSNLFIGDNPMQFEIGGIDLYTVTDAQGYPYIPGSSLKGMLRRILEEDDGTKKTKISEIYKKYLNEILKKYDASNIDIDQSRFNNLVSKHKELIDTANANFLFGIAGYNKSPKLYVSDSILSDKSKDLNQYFSIDTKNSITSNPDNKSIESNPRTYKTVRSGITFKGEIFLGDMAEFTNEEMTHCKAYVEEMLLKFNEGFYRLGNSKSRGYGRILAKLNRGE